MPTNTQNWPEIDPGTFRHRITLLQQVLGTDTSGVETTYKPVSPSVTAWVSFNYMRGTDVIKSGQDVSQVYITLIGWWRTQFTANSRIQTDDGDQFIVQAVENIKRMNTYMVLTCIGFGNND